MHLTLDQYSEHVLLPYIIHSINSQQGVYTLLYKYFEQGNDRDLISFKTSC